MKKLFIVFCLICTAKAQFTYQNKIYPSGEGVYFGYHTIIVDSLMFISDTQDWSNGHASGSVYYYKNNNNSWNFIRQIIPEDGQPRDLFGKISLNMDELYIGASGNRGSVYVYKYDNNDWYLVQKLRPDSLIYLSAFGKTILSNGEQLFVGAPSDSRYVDAAGAVYVYERINGTWQKVQKIYSNEQMPYAHFGNALAYNSNHSQLIISAPESNNQVGFIAGNVYILGKSEAGWEIVQILTPDPGEAFPYFGGSLQTDGDYLFVGAPGSGSTQSGGLVYVYRIESGKWVLFNKIESPINIRRDYFGSSLAYNNNTLLVGAPGDVNNGARTAYAYLYRQKDRDFVLDYNFAPDDSFYYDKFGIGVSMNNNEYLIGAYMAKNGGRAYLYSDYPLSTDKELNDVKGYSLLQNYPNPFNSQTKIRFSITEPEIVKIILFDILGREIEVLVNEYKNAGDYEIEFDSGNLTSGVYLVRMVYKNYSEIRKMVLLR